MSYFINNGLKIGGQAQVRAEALAGGVGAQAIVRSDPASTAARAIEDALELIEKHRNELTSPEVAAAELGLAKAELVASSPDRGRVLAAIRRATAHVGEVTALAVAMQHAADVVRSALT